MNYEVLPVNQDNCIFTTNLNEDQIAKVRLWIEELESGKHRKGTGALMCNNGSECCLGVAATGVLGLKPIQVPYLNFRFSYRNETTTSFLPGESYKELGLNDDSGSPLGIKSGINYNYIATIEGTYRDSLSGINDDNHTDDYKVITEVIKKHLEWRLANVNL